MMVTIHEHAAMAVHCSINLGKPQHCAPTMDNYTHLVEHCTDRRLQDDGSINFENRDQGWFVIMLRRPW